MKAAKIDEMKVNTYTWIKILQDIILAFLGIVFVILGVVRIKNDGTAASETVSYCVAIALMIYGLINVLSGYMLERSPLSKEAFLGVVICALGIVLVFKPAIIISILPLFLITAVYLYSVLCIISGIDNVLGKGIKKDTRKGVLLFIASGLLIIAATVYIFYYDNPTVLNYVLVSLGVAFVAFSIFSFVMLMIKVKNTKKLIQEAHIQEEQEKALKIENETKEVKVVTINDLKKKTGKKVTNKVKAIENKDVKMIEESKEGE